MPERNHSPVVQRSSRITSSGGGTWKGSSYISVCGIWKTEGTPLEIG